MEYAKTIIMKDGRACILRNATERDAEAVLGVFDLTHEQTDFLTSYPDESTRIPSKTKRRFCGGERKTDGRSRSLPKWTEKPWGLRGSAASVPNTNRVTGRSSASAYTRTDRGGR